MTEENLGNPGNLNVEELSITAHSGSKFSLVDPTANMLSELNIFEDMWNKFMTGSVIVKDSTNLITKAPIMGGELITIKLRTPTMDDHPNRVINKTFMIYSIENRTLNSDREQTYVLNFCSVEMVMDASFILQQRFEGNTEDIIKKIFEDYTIEARNPAEQDHSNVLVVGDTPHSSKVSFIANNWTPTQTFDYMSKYIKGASGTGADFVFFESNKRMYYTSIQALIKSQRDVMFDEYVYAIKGLDLPRRSVGEYSSDALPNGWVTIDNMSIPRTIDIIDGQMTGYYAQTVRAYDLFTKERLEVKLDIREDFDKFEHTEPGIPIPEGTVRNPYSMTTMKVLNSANNLTQSYNIPGSKGGNGDNENVIGAQLLRDNYLNSLRDYKFEIDVPGRTDIEVGKMIYISYPAPVSKTEDLEYDELFDKQLSGKYLITGIRHKIDTVGYVMKMEIVKNGLPESMGPPEEK